MTEFVWSKWQTVKHQLYDSLILVGMRDRLRCPKCGAVGTWKPHGGWFERWQNFRQGMRQKVEANGARYATDRRWLCKYCGYNLAKDGQHWCGIDKQKKVWAVRGKGIDPPPKEIIDPVWPWRG